MPISREGFGWSVSASSSENGILPGIEVLSPTAMGTDTGMYLSAPSFAGTTRIAVSAKTFSFLIARATSRFFMYSDIFSRLLSNFATLGQQGLWDLTLSRSMKRSFRISGDIYCDVFASSKKVLSAYQRFYFQSGMRIFFFSLFFQIAHCFTYWGLGMRRRGFRGIR